MSVVHAVVTTMASRVVCRDQLKLQVQKGKEKLDRLQVELDRLQVELDGLQMELGEAEEDLQKIGTIMASLREVCEPPDGHDGNLDGTDRDSWKFANVIAQTEGQLQQFWVTEYDPQESKSRSTLSCTDSDPGSYTNNG